MSTCMGAPAPHKNCPHGKRCDWGKDAEFAAKVEAARHELCAHPIGVCKVTRA